MRRSVKSKFIPRWKFVLVDEEYTSLQQIGTFPSYFEGIGNTEETAFANALLSYNIRILEKKTDFVEHKYFGESGMLLLGAWKDSARAWYMVHRSEKTS